nr:DUF1285 domain-containing protein [uncultured Cohaesibacter sp.]
MNDKQHPQKTQRGAMPTGEDGALLPTMPASLSALMERAGDNRALPPVETWHPEFCGDIDMRIASDGTWFYRGTPILRDALVRLFASVLRREEDGQTYLVTPVEKLRIAVEDAPFLAVEMAAEADMPDNGGRLVFRTNVDDLVPLDADHPLRFALEDETHGLKAYLRVRGGLEALVTRALMFDLVALAEEGTGDTCGHFGVRSGDAFFPICSMEELAMLEGMA